MDTMKTPPEWSNLFAGDRIHSTLPLHRIETYIDALKSDGFEFTTEPSPRGYWLVCTASPRVSPHREAAA